MPGQPKWFWTVEQLAVLRPVIDEVAERDDEGLYIGPVGLGRYVFQQLYQLGHRNMASARVDVALDMLMYLEVLERGARGVKKEGYKRRYDRNKWLSLTEGDILRYREWNRLGRKR